MFAYICFGTFLFIKVSKSAASKLHKWRRSLRWRRRDFQISHYRPCNYDTKSKWHMCISIGAFVNVIGVVSNTFSSFPEFSRYAYSNYFVGIKQLIQSHNFSLMPELYSDENTFHISYVICFSYLSAPPPVFVWRDERHAAAMIMEKTICPIWLDESRGKMS